MTRRHVTIFRIPVLWEIDPVGETGSAFVEPDVVHQLLGAREALEVADLGAQPDRGQRVDPAQAAQPPDIGRPRRVAQPRDDLALELVAAVHERVDRADRIQQRRLRGAVTELDTGQPGPVALRPGAPVIKSDPAPQQQLAQPMPTAHQIDPHGLARAHDSRVRAGVARRRRK
jgi:hypothetical protein